MNLSIPNKAIILAAGKCSRFEPFAGHGNKANFIIMGKSVIERTVESLILAGICNIGIVISNEDKRIRESLKKFENKAKINFYFQEKAKGQADAILKACKNINSRFLVINQQQFNNENNFGLLKDFLEKNPNFPDDAVLLFHQETNSPEKCGIVTLDKNRVIKVEEKPQHLKGKTAQRIIGIYWLTPEFIEELKKLKQEEYQFEVCLDLFAKKGKVYAIENNFKQATLKYVWDIFSLSNLIFEKLGKKQIISKKAKIHKTAIITGPVIIEDGAEIYEYSLIKGPCYIGKSVVIGSFCKVRDNTILEEGVTLQNQVEITRSYLGRNSSIHSGFIGDSIIGENVKIGAGFITANKRLDRKEILIPINNKLINSNKTAFGCLIGNEVKIGIFCGSNPGTVLKFGEIIYPKSMIGNKK